MRGESFAMLKRSFEYNLLFFKVSISSIYAYIMLLIIPTFFMIWNNREWFTQSPSESEFYGVISGWIAFILVYGYINGVGVNLLLLREQGFFKMFYYLSGSRIPLVIGNIIAQTTTLLISITIFSIIIGLLFNFNVFTILSFAYVLTFITCIPISLFSTWISCLKVQQETVVPLATVSIFPLIYFTSINIDFPPNIQYILMINPIELVIQISNLIFKFLHNIELYENTILIAILLFYIAYILIGIYFTSKIKISSVKNRT
jgi:ABC-2 type transport system permease protein